MEPFKFSVNRKDWENYLQSMSNKTGDEFREYVKLTCGIDIISLDNAIYVGSDIISWHYVADRYKILYPEENLFNA